MFINTDLVAIGSISELNNQGIKVPEQINVIGLWRL
ncbi:hypothetical protein [Polaribacter sp. Asnod6-C07]